jgi:hypothetical protein
MPAEAVTSSSNGYVAFFGWKSGLKDNKQLAPWKVVIASDLSTESRDKEYAWYKTLEDMANGVLRMIHSSPRSSMYEVIRNEDCITYLILDLDRTMSPSEMASATSMTAAREDTIKVFMRHLTSFLGKLSIGELQVRRAGCWRR